MFDFKYYLENNGEFGVVQEIKHPIVTLSGLPNAKPTEVVITETGVMGQVFSVERDSIKILVFSKLPLNVGQRVARTDLYLAVHVGEELIGHVINPLGKTMFTGDVFEKPKDIRELEQDVKKIYERARITKPLATGVTVVDLMVPLGKGQRELVIGDRKTGKTAFLNTIIKSQIDEGSLVVYCAIGKKKGEIKRMVEYFTKQGLLKNMIMVATDSQESASLIYLTPFTAMTIAEYFRDKGKDVLVLYDDLTTHAKFYREMSLLGDRFPGRDSYPGDIFYTHAKLLERAGNVKFGADGASAITCLALVETIEADLTGYIQTNLMGITDGHIFFDSNAFYNGRRPAINIAISVTRVGKQTQTKLKKEINGMLSSFLAKYEKIQNFSHFGSELSPEIVQMLKKGEKLYEFFDQHYDMALPGSVQLIILALVWLGIFDHEEPGTIDKYKLALITAYKNEKTREVLKQLTQADTFEALLQKIRSKAADIINLCKINSESTPK